MNEIDWYETIRRFLIVWRFRFVGGFVEIVDGFLTVCTIGIYGGSWARDYWEYVEAYYRLNFPDMYDLALKDLEDRKRRLDK
jgi:hypothetical protein